jgi:hypothetical protein
MAQLLFIVRAFFRLVSRRGDVEPARHKAESHTHWDPSARTWRDH